MSPRMSAAQPKRSSSTTCSRARTRCAGDPSSTQRNSPVATTAPPMPKKGVGPRWGSSFAFRNASAGCCFLNSQLVPRHLSRGRPARRHVECRLCLISSLTNWLPRCFEALLSSSGCFQKLVRLWNVISSLYPFIQALEEGHFDVSNVWRLPCTCIF